MLHIIRRERMTRILAFGIMVMVAIALLPDSSYAQFNNEVKEPGNCPMTISWPVSKGGGNFNPFWHNFSFGGADQKTYTPMADPTLSDDGQYMWIGASLTLRCWNWVKYDAYGRMEYVNPAYERVGELGGRVVKKSNCQARNDENRIPLSGARLSRGLTPDGQSRIMLPVAATRSIEINADGTCSADTGASGEGSLPAGFTALVCETVDYYIYYFESDTKVYQYSVSHCYYIM